MRVLVREALPRDGREVVTVRSDDDVPSAARVLLRHRIASAPVLDADGRLVGVVSESDLLRGRLARDPRAHFLERPDEDAPPRLVADVMTEHPVTVDVHGDLADAVHLLVERGIRALPVLDGRRLVGVLARRDVLRVTTLDDEEVRDAVAAKLAADLPGQSWTVEVTDGVVVLAGPHEEAARRIAAVLARTVPGVVRVGGEEPTSVDAPVRRERP